MRKATFIPISGRFSGRCVRWLNQRVFLILRSQKEGATFARRPFALRWWSQPVSRVLYALRRDSHSSRPGVAARLQQPTREQRGPRYRSPIWSCSGWGLPSRTTLAPYAVRSYRTLSPLPDPLAGPSAVCSLLHWPSAHAAQELPGTLPCGARTFLDPLARDATVRPTPGPMIQHPA